jgi:hypothetical protein
MTDCTHADVFWKVDTDSACNEDGWTCAYCDLRLGFRPAFDRQYAAGKVHDLMSVMHDRGLIYISTGTQGADIASAVADQCEQDDEYDQYTMINWITLHAGGESHADFWQERARLVMSGLKECTCGHEPQHHTRVGKTDYRECFWANCACASYVSQS